MFGSFESAVLALVFFLFGIFAGVGLGERLVVRCVTKKEYVIANVLTLLAGAVVSAIVMITPYPMFVTLVIGLIGGTIAGLKMGFGESVGPWKAHDRYFRVNKEQLKRSETGERAEAVRRARRDGTPEPELMSVMDDGPASKKK